MKKSREVGIEVNINNQSKIIIVYELNKKSVNYSQKSFINFETDFSLEADR